MVPDRKLILNLIKDHLTNVWLTGVPHRQGETKHECIFHSSESVLILMGFKEGQQRENGIQLYESLIQKAQKMNFENESSALNDLSLEIYKELLLGKEIK